MAVEQTIEDIYPLSPMQQGMLFHILYAPEAGSNIFQMSCLLKGDLSKTAFRRALARVIERHAVLRTSFLWEDMEQPLQVVDREVPLPFEEQDWSGLSDEERWARLDARLAADLVQGFDLAQAPLLRVLLAREAPGRHRLVWSLQGILLDGWSLPVLLGEVFLHYEAFRAGGDPHLPMPRPYRDYIAWLLQKDPAEGERFWRRELQGFARATPLPGDRGPGGRPVMDQRRIFLSEEATAALQALARAERLTVNTLVQGAWALLLARASGERDVVFGATVSGRPADLPGVESMIGLFINTLPVRWKLDPGERLIDALRRLQERQSEARQFEHTPLVDIQGWSDVPRGLPLFESIVAFENFPVAETVREVSGSLQADEAERLDVSGYPLALEVVPGKRLSLRLTYDGARLQARTIESLLDQLSGLLAAMTGLSGQTIAELAERRPALSEAELHQLLVEWNGGAPQPMDVPVPVAFAAQAARTPGAVAVAGRGGVLTYAELDRRAAQLARRLRRLGVGRESRVALFCERVPELILGVLGIWKAGGAYVPLEPSLPGPRLAFMVEDVVRGLDAPVVVAHPDLSGRMTMLPESVRVVWLGEEILEDAEPLEDPAPGDLAYLIYTSGTTGHPKAVQVEHGSLAHTLAGVQRLFGLEPGDRMPSLCPSSFDVFLFEVWGPLLAGGTSVLFDLYPAPDLERLVEALRGSTLLHAVPSLMRQVVEAVETHPGSGDRLRWVFSAGDAVPADLLAAMQRAFPSARVVILYGPTVATVFASWYAARQGESGARAMLGRPLPGFVLDLRDRDGLLVPVGTPAEVWLGGPSVARGYLHRPGLTAERFVPAAEGRFYRTGDLARRLPDGSVEFLGRVDQQVKVRGFRIELEEVEAALAAHPRVCEAVVAAWEDGGEKRLAAYIVPAEGAAPPAGELRRFLLERLPEHMVPAVFVPLSALPLTPHGKIDRRALPDPGFALAGPAEYVPPRGPAEEVVAGLWSEILGVERVGAFDSFFALGGHSLLANQLRSRVKRAFDVDLPLADLFARPTLAEVAAAVEALRDADRPRATGMKIAAGQRQRLRRDDLDGRS
jgi:amino acid adenylation domain-containing protein